MPVVTVALPVFNDVQYISETIESVLSQSFREFIFVISDNASTDGTSEICEAFAEKDSRINYIRQPNNIGAHENFRHLLDRCETEFFMWIGSHDKLNSTYLMDCLETLRANKRIVLTYGEITFINPDNSVVGSDLVKIDTRRVPFWLGYLRFLWELEGCFKFHGLARAWAAKAVLTRKNFYGVDHHYLACMCLVGEVAISPKAEYKARIIRSGETFQQKVDRVLSDHDMANPRDKSRMLWKGCEKEHIRSILKYRKLSIWTPILIAATKHAFKNRFQKFTRDALEGKYSI